MNKSVDALSETVFRLEERLNIVEKKLAIATKFIAEISPPLSALFEDKKADQANVIALASAIGIIGIQLEEASLPLAPGTLARLLDEDLERFDLDIVSAAGGVLEMLGHWRTA